MQKQVVRRFAAVWVLGIVMLGLAACGGVSDTSVPPPPSSTVVQSGSNAMIDVFVSAFRSEMVGQLTTKGGQLDKEAYYTTPSSLSEVATFYSTEMKKRGWKETTNETDANGTVLGYDSGNNSVAIFITEGSTLDTEGTFVMTLNASNK